ncbi:MAG TPA: hypothetical protein VMD30_06315 [Tepidisphaeraceae bacterium]|nr:hypothetical protein [Tepidisphaeraceae bacterium]
MPSQLIATADWSAARRHLSRRDPIMRQILREIGPCTLRRRRDYFAFLCRSIYSQQISTAVAAALFAHFRTHFPRRRPTPVLTRALLAQSNGSPHPRGLSRQKKTYLLDLADHFLNNRIPSRRLSRMSDEQIIDALIRVRGIGRWTAEMFLIFVLNRPDVLPVDDLGLRIGIQKAYGLKDRPTAAQIRQLAAPWEPHRTLATWALWRYLEHSKKNKMIFTASSSLSFRAEGHFAGDAEGRRISFPRRCMARERTLIGFC